MGRPTGRDDIGVGGRGAGGSPRPDTERLGRLVRLMDDAVEIPLLGLRVGLDGLLGLVPGAGDVAGAVVSAWIVVRSIQLGASPSVVIRMLLNLAVDAVTGAVPVAGDLFDLAFKANRRNLALLEDHLAEPGRVRRRSRAVLLAGVGTVVGVVLGTTLVVWQLLAALAGLLGGLLG